MNGQPLVTVATVSFNSSRYIRDAIESVLAQTYTNIEYIIGDDGSTDDTWDIINEYQDARIKSYRNEKNLGEYINRNKAIDRATGKYFIFIDGDDIIFPHGVGYFVGMMEDFPEVGMAIQKNYYNNILYPALFRPEETLRNHFYGKDNLLSSSFASDFFKTSLLKQWKLSTKYITGDEEIRLKIALHFPVLFVAGWVTWPRETPGQASKKVDVIKGLEESYLFTGEIMSMAASAEIEPALVEDIRATKKKRLARLLLNLFRRGDIAQAQGLLKRTSFSWKEVLKYVNYVPVFQDILLTHSADHPFKRGFLAGQKR